jgi:hypothetical protein
MWCCHREGAKSAEQREYERLREALARKQEEVRRLQAQCEAITTPERGQLSGQTSLTPALEEVDPGAPKS